MKLPSFVLLLLLAFTWIAPAQAADAPAGVTTETTPFDGKRPKTFTDTRGQVHLTFNDQGNVYYSRWDEAKNAFRPPIQVNSIDQSAAISEMAVGEDGRVHIVFHGNIHYIREQIKGEDRKLQGSDIKYTFYTRLNAAGDAFEPQRDLSGGVWGFDGGCAIAANLEGGVYIFMGGTTKQGKETDRRIFLTQSTDHGETFSAPRAMDLGKGVCMCCHLKAQWSPRGELMLAYRVAEDSVDRDSYLLVSTDDGKSFDARPLDQWKLRACPGSVYSFVNLPDKTLVSWRNEDEVFFGPDGEHAGSPPAKERKRRVAVLGRNVRNEILMAWSEGENFNQPHDLRWQLYNASGEPVGEPGVKKNIFKRWGNPALFAREDGDFVILH